MNSFHVFNEATGLWEDLPPMPHACTRAALGVIGNELFIAGGYASPWPPLATLQIYNFTTRTWRLGAALPEPRRRAIGVVADGKLFVISYNSTREDLLVYDSQSDTWTEAAPPPAVTNSLYISRACAHKGQLVVFLSDGTACERADDGSWYPYEVARGCGHDDLVESVILG